MVDRRVVGMINGERLQKLKVFCFVSFFSCSFFLDLFFIRLPFLRLKINVVINVLF